MITSAVSPWRMRFFRSAAKPYPMDSLFSVAYSYTGVCSFSEEVSTTDASTFSSAAWAVSPAETNPNTAVTAAHTINEILVTVSSPSLISADIETKVAGADRAPPPSVSYR